jgi:hypothetical protein
VVVLVASPFKETVGLLLLPTFFIVTVGDGSWKAALRGGALLAAVSAAGALLLRSGALFTTSSGLIEYLSFYTMDYVGDVRSSWGGLLGATIAVVFTLGSAWLIGAVGFLAAPTRFRLLSSMAALAVLQIALATDVERMVAAGIPVLGPLFAFALASVDVKRALVLTAAGSVYFSAHFLAPHLAMRDPSWTMWVILAYVGSAVLTLAALRPTETGHGFRGSLRAATESGDISR